MTQKQKGKREKVVQMEGRQEGVKLILLEPLERKNKTGTVHV